jgi:hypothetical protein
MFCLCNCCKLFHIFSICIFPLPERNDLWGHFSKKLLWVDVLPLWNWSGLWYTVLWLPSLFTQHACSVSGSMFKKGYVKKGYVKLFIIYQITHYSISFKQSKQSKGFAFSLSIVNVFKMLFSSFLAEMNYQHCQVSHNQLLRLIAISYVIYVMYFMYPFKDWWQRILWWRIYLQGWGCLTLNYVHTKTKHVRFLCIF